MSYYVSRCLVSVMWLLCVDARGRETYRGGILVGGVRQIDWSHSLGCGPISIGTVNLVLKLVIPHVILHF